MIPGPQPCPRLRLNPKLRETVRAAMRGGLPAWKIAQAAGFPQPQLFSTKLHARRVKATPLNVKRFQRVADLVEFPREEIFLEDEA